MNQKTELYRFHQKLNSELISSELPEQIKISNHSHEALYEYTENFNSEVKRKVFSPVKEASIVKSILSSRVFLFGDFHALDASHQILVQLLSKVHQADPSRKIAIFLESFKSDANDLLDQFSAGKISFDGLIEESNYCEYWDYDIASLKPILELAKLNQWQLIGIYPNSSINIHKRDEFAADIVKNYLKENPSALTTIMIGESHLLKDHLPSQLVEFSGQMTRVITNLDHISWAQLDDQNLLTEHFFQLSDDFYCIQNSCTWIKKLSYLMCVEEYEYDIDFYNESSFDFEHFVVSCCLQISNELGFKPAKNLLENIQVNMDSTRNQIDFLSPSYCGLEGTYSHHKIELPYPSISKLVRPISAHLWANLSQRSSPLSRPLDIATMVSKSAQDIISYMLDPVSHFWKEKQNNKLIFLSRSKKVPIEWSKDLLVTKSFHDLGQLLKNLLKNPHIHVLEPIEKSFPELPFEKKVG